MRVRVGRSVTRQPNQKESNDMIEHRTKHGFATLVWLREPVGLRDDCFAKIEVTSSYSGRVSVHIAKATKKGAKIALSAAIKRACWANERGV